MISFLKSVKHDFGVWDLFREMVELMGGMKF